MSHVAGLSSPGEVLARKGISLEALSAGLDRHLGFPREFYWDADLFSLEMDAIFHRRWQYFTPLAEVSSPGDVVSGVVGTTPIMVARGRDGVLRGFVNMCRHRMFPVVEKEKVEGCNRLMCRYHSWVYSLDGALVRAPDTEGEPDFEKASNGLIPVAVDVWGPAVFVNVDASAPPLRQAMPELFDFAREQGYDEDIAHYRFHSRYDKHQAANWKLWTDNGVECYHCASVHGDSFGDVVAVDLEDGKQQLRHRGSVMYNPFKIKPPAPGEMRARFYRTLLLFPAAHILQLDGLMVLGRMVPKGPDACTYTAHYYAEEGTDEDKVQAWIDIFNQTFDEDAELVEKQQLGLHSPFAKPFRYVESREPTALATNRLILGDLIDYVAGPSPAVAVNA